jgi:hypothetical protein
MHGFNFFVLSVPSCPNPPFYSFILTDFFSIISTQIREILNLPDLTPEEEVQAREEHKWIFEDGNN